LNYTFIEKDFLAVVHAINKFRNYITGYEVFIHIDHSVIRYLLNKPITNGIINRWTLFIWEFNMTILDRHGRENVVSYFVSRIHNKVELVLVNDNFPNENSVSISIKYPWFLDIANYLST
jgi:hypothetical protein